MNLNLKKVAHIATLQAVGVIFENEEELGEVHPTPSTKDNSDLFDTEEVDLSHLGKVEKEKNVRFIV